MQNQAMTITKIKNIYIMLLHAISKENISIVDHYLDDKLKIKINEWMETNKQNNIKIVFRQQNIANLVILQEDEHNIVFQAEIRHISYYVNRQNNKLVSGDKENRITKKVILKFRKNQVTNKTVIHCPNCGATLQINTTGICDYCQKSLNDKYSQFVLYSID